MDNPGFQNSISIGRRTALVQCKTAECREGTRLQEEEDGAILVYKGEEGEIKIRDEVDFEPGVTC